MYGWRRPLRVALAGAKGRPRIAGQADPAIRAWPVPGGGTANAQSRGRGRRAPGCLPEGDDPSRAVCRHAGRKPGRAARVDFAHRRECVIDVIRKRRDGKLFSLEEPSGAGEETLGNNAAACQDNPEERFARREMRKLMADAIMQLAPDMRQVCLLRDVLQYSTQECAARLGISAIAVRLRLFRAYRRLREKLSVTLELGKQSQTRGAAVVEIARRGEKRKREPRVPLAAFAECACGD